MKFTEKVKWDESAWNDATPEGIAKDIVDCIMPLRSKPNARTNPVTVKLTVEVEMR